jgi:hypothetical protein
VGVGVPVGSVPVGVVVPVGVAVRVPRVVVAEGLGVRVAVREAVGVSVWVGDGESVALGVVVGVSVGVGGTVSEGVDVGVGASVFGGTQALKTSPKAFKSPGTRLDALERKPVRLPSAFVKPP